MDSNMSSNMSSVMSRMMSRIKRIVLLSAVSCFLLSCSDERDGILKVYNWADYIGENVIEDFEQWYEEQTGEKVTIVYQTFDVNETMLSKIEKGHEDYDVVCPSDYIIERMLRNDLLLPIGDDFGQTPNYIKDNISPFIRHCIGTLDASGKDPNDYAASYMWGTVGIMYNPKFVDEQDTRSWGILRNSRYSGRILVKDAPRDVYGPMLIYLKHDEILEGKTTREALMYDSSDESIALVQNYLESVRDSLLGWEADFGKEIMTQEKAYLNVTWSGDSQWAIEEAAEIGVELKYTIPDEGSNVWFDGWVIPKYAKNPKAARYFINFMCRKDIAMRNMDAAGYVSVISDPEILDYVTDSTYAASDVSYFFGPDVDSACVSPTFYPDKSIIDKCVAMHDWGDDTPKLTRMWSQVKGDAATPFTYVVIFTTLALLIITTVYKRLHKWHRLRNRMK